MTDFKKGGPLQNSNIFATNRLFVKNPLFKKKKKKRAPGVYNPKGKFKYEDGGEPPYNNLPPTYLAALRNFIYPNVSENPELVGYDSVNNTINYDSQSSIENMSNDWWREHELFHDLQNQAGGMSTSGVVGQRPNSYAASDESMQGYYNRRDADVERTIDRMIAQDPNLQFIPRNKLAEGAGPGFIGAEDLQYADPTTVEGEARQYEQYIREGNPSIFPNRKKGGSIMDLTEEEIQKYIDGGYVVEEINDPSIPKLDRLKPGGAPCPRGQMRDASGKCVPYNWGSGNIQAADSYTGMYGGYDASGTKNLTEVKASAKKGKKLSDYILRGGKTKADEARKLGKNAGQYFGMPGEALEPVNFTKAGLEKYKKEIKDAKKNFEAEEKNKAEYEKARKKLEKSKDQSAGTKFRQEYEKKGWDRFDADVAEGSGPGADYSAADARKEWGDSDQWNKFIGLVSNAATAIPLLGAAGAMGSAGAAILENPYVQAGLTGYGLYDATTNTLPEAYKDFKEGRYWEGLGNTALGALDFVPGVAFAGKGLGKAINYVGDLGSDIGKGIKTLGTNKAYSLANKGSKNLDIDATPNIEFQGAQTFDYGDVPEVLSGLRQRGQNLDELGVKGSELLHPDMINYHGTYSGRPIVEVKMPDGSSEMFYKSSGWAGKQGAGTDGTTAGMWQVYGGHSKSPNADNWFIKDYGYTDYYGSNTYKEMAENLNNALGQKYGFKNTDELDTAFNFQNKQGSVNTYTPSANDPSSTAFYKSKNTGTNTSTGLTEADIAATRAEEEAWLTSDEYLKRRMKNTGESAKAVREDVAKILKRADKANYNVNADLKGAHGEMATNIFINPKVSVSKTAPNPKKVLRHENIHLYSPASKNKSILGTDLHKGWDNPNVAELKASERGVYANYPTIGDSPESIMYADPSDYHYNMLGYEQQARHLGAMRDIAAKNNVDIKAGKKLTEQQVRSHIDDFIKNRENVDYDYDEIWGAEILNERKKLADAFGAPLDEIKKIDPDKYKEIINVSKDNAAKRITKVLNNAWVVAPTVGVAGTATMLANPFQGSDGLQQQKKGGSTDEYIELDIPEEEIQWYIDNGYRVEPVSKLKKFIG